MPYERDNIHRLHAYVPGEQPSYRETDGGVAGAGGVIKLNTNENPYPPSPKVMDAIRTVSPEALRLYPPPMAKPFRKAAAKVHDLSPENVIATNGGDELLRLLVTVFCEPGSPGSVSGATYGSSGGGGGIGMTRPSYSLYSVLADIQDTPLTVIDRGVGDDPFALPADLPERWNAAGCRLAFIVNPHAPSGRFESPDTLRDIATRFRGRGVLVIDEAYVDFAPDNALQLVRDGLPNVVLLRSLSKGYGLAGLRFGYGLGHPDLIAAMDKARDSYNTDILAQLAATAAIEDQDYARKTWESVKSERTRLLAALRDRGYTGPDSHTNFLLVTPPTAVTSGGAKAIYLALKERNILIRYFDTPGLTDKLRITLGTPEQNDTLLAALDEIGARG